MPLDENKKQKIIKTFGKYTLELKKLLTRKYGESNAESIISIAKGYFPAIVDQMPYFKTPMYDTLIVTSGKMLALKKALKDKGIGVEEFIQLMLEHTRISQSKTPKAILKFGGKVFLSKIMRSYLNNVAIKVTAYGWPTEVINGSGDDDFEMKVCTRNCQMVEFIKIVGEDDLIPYCSFMDFANAESMGYSLKQTTRISSGVCTFCFNKKGPVQWPDNLQKILENAS